MLNSLDYNSCPSILASRTHILSYFYKLPLLLYLFSEYLLNFLSNFYIPSCVEKHSDLWSWNSLKKHWFKALLLMSLSTQNSSQCPCHYALGRRKLLISAGRTLLIICSPNSEKGGKKLWLFYQNSVRKCEDNLEHYIFYILFDLQFFQTWWFYSFVNNIYHIVWY